MNLRSTLGAAVRHVHNSLYVRPADLVTDQPIVSFCFDDFPRTAYLVGGEILKSLGARATYYAAFGLMNGTTNLGEQFTLEDVQSLLTDGHELGLHTYSHFSGRMVSSRVFETDTLRGRDMIRTMTGREAEHFSYPYGHVTLALKKRIGKLMKSCRGIQPGINGPDVDLNLLRAKSLYGDVDQFADVESLLKQNQTRKGWLILYTHDVQSKPTGFGCTPALLDKAASAALAMGCRVEPVGTVVKSAIVPRA